jgi:uncharacterized protein YjbI with pentapeptide repeats
MLLNFLFSSDFLRLILERDVNSFMRISMTNTPAPLDPIAQLVAKYQSNGHQTIPTQHHPAPQPEPKKDRTGFAGKTLWDWLNLLGVLLVPLILGAGTILITAQQSAISQSQHESDQKIANNRLQEDLLKTFRDDINRLVFDQHLLTAKSGDTVQTMAQSYTNDALRKLDLSRRTLLVQFLSDLHLIASTTADPPLISLARVDVQGIDLRGANLEGANLEGANLKGAYLIGTDLAHVNLKVANLQGVYLIEANLQGASLGWVNLRGAYLGGANLQGVNLENANLEGAYLVGPGGQRVDFGDGSSLWFINPEANLHGADLYEANLQRANAIPEQLAEAYRLKYATLPDGSGYPSSTYPIPNHQEPTN